MDTLGSKLRAQGWSHLFLQSEHQHMFGRDKVYEFYKNRVALGNVLNYCSWGLPLISILLTLLES